MAPKPTRDTNIHEAPGSAPPEDSQKLKRAIFGWAAVGVGFAAAAALAVAALADDGAATSALTRTGDVKDHPRYGQGDSNPAPWTGDAKDHPGYGPVAPATQPWTGDAKDHRGYGPASPSGEPTSPDVRAFCEAAVDAEAAFLTEDPALIGPAVATVTAAAPNEIAATVDAVIANAEGLGPEWEKAYAELIGYMKRNCGFTELDIVASEYTFSGIPAELPAGPTILSLENAGSELHLVALMRVNDDVTLTTEELAVLPEEELLTMATTIGAAFAAPGTEGYGVADLTAGRYVAICPIPEGLTPEIAAEFDEAEPEQTVPSQDQLGAPHSVHGMFHEFTVH